MILYKKFSPAPTNRNRAKGTLTQSARTKFLRTGVQSVLVLRTNLRDSEREPAITEPPKVRLAAVRAQPATIVATVRVEQDRTASGIFDGFVHGNDPPETHRLDLLVGERLTDEAGDFGIRGFELALGREGTNLLRDPIVVLEKHAFEDSDLGGDARGRLEVRRTEHALGVIPDPEAFALEPFDPLWTSRAVGRNAEVDDAVLFAPGASWL